MFTFLQDSFCPFYVSGSYFPTTLELPTTVVNFVLIT